MNIERLYILLEGSDEARVYEWKIIILLSKNL